MYATKDFKGLTGDCNDTKTGLARLKSLGFTAVWVTPPVRNQVTTGGTAGYTLTVQLQ